MCGVWKLSSPGITSPPEQALPAHPFLFSLLFSFRRSSFSSLFFLLSSFFFSLGIPQKGPSSNFCLPSDGGGAEPVLQGAGESGGEGGAGVAGAGAVAEPHGARDRDGGGGRAGCAACEAQVY